MYIVPARALRFSISLLVTVALTLFGAHGALAASDVVISQVYGGGGNSGATFKNDFVELFNRGAAAVDISGWSIQYASASGATWQKTNLTGVVIQPGQYVLVQQAQGTGGTTSLPTPDVVGTIAMSATAGKLALVRNSTTLVGSCPAGAVDLVGYGSTASCSETTPVAALSNTSAALRANDGCVDTDNNTSDFATAAPSSRNSATPFKLCGAVANQPVTTTCPATLAVTAGAGGNATLQASDADGQVISAAITSGAVAGISLGTLSPASANGGTASVPLNVSASVVTGSYLVQIAFGNADATPQTASCTVNVSVGGGASGTRIHDIQGASHISPRNGQVVSDVPGIVTAKRGNGFYLQDPIPDADPATSEGIFVFTSTAPTVTVGDSIIISGTVSEFRPGGASGQVNLTTTEIISPIISLLSSGNPLPAAVIVGNGGRLPPGKVIDSGASGDVETQGTFNAANDGLDFYESLEGMRVQVNGAQAVGPTSSFGEIAVVGDYAANASLRTPRGGVVIAADDFNPERIILDDALIGTMPKVNVGDSFTSVTGVMDYSFGNYKLELTQAPPVVTGPIQAEVTVEQAANQLAIASFNVENLAPTDPPAKFQALATQVANNLKSPDIIGVMEMQDDNGATNDAVVSADITFNTLISAIQTAGGPAYQYRQINPVDDQDGGQPGGNIRVGFLFNPARVSFVDRPGGSSTAAVSVIASSGGPQLSASPGRVNPTNTAFNSSRKPLAGEFIFNGRKLFLVANHFNSKGGDQPLFGRYQPPARSSEVQRKQQATVLAGFVNDIRAADANANIVVLGDINDFEFSETLGILKAAGLHDLVENLPAEERYTYVYEGNSQVLDHILVSDALAASAAPEYDVVHVNAEFAVTRSSDHEPEVVRLNLPPLLAVNVTAQVSTSISGLTYNRASQTFSGTIKVTNTGVAAISGPIQVELGGLPAGVTLVNASGSHAGAPYVTTAVASLAAGQTLSVPVRFSNPSRVSLNYSVTIYSGNF